MSFELPKLDFSYEALEPYFDAQTMEIHYTKHHQAYITKLNQAIEGTEYQNKSIEEILKSVKSMPDTIVNIIRNNGGGHYNHTLFWSILSPKKQEPTEKILKLINKSFGNFEEFKKRFTEAAVSRFGSGWAWLIATEDSLNIESTANQDAPIMENKKAILGLDVWEHAYYLKYQNRRPDYIEAFFQIVNWQKVEDLYTLSISENQKIS